MKQARKTSNDTSDIEKPGKAHCASAPIAPGSNTGGSQTSSANQSGKTIGFLQLPDLSAGQSWKMANRAIQSRNRAPITSSRTHSQERFFWNSSFGQTLSMPQQAAGRPAGFFVAGTGTGSSTWARTRDLRIIELLRLP